MPPDPGPEGAAALVQIDAEIRAILAAALDQVPMLELRAPPFDTMIASYVDNLRVISREPAPEWASAIADDYRNGRAVTPVELRRPPPRPRRSYHRGRPVGRGSGPRWGWATSRYTEPDDEEEDDL